ncbi:HD domain-containing protein [Mucilaginibacter sp. JRF]|uniref:Pycsar system effector family protein n=1 Tax=Mucilaginibacter sp. JRF TaxID=2780088 RepID=UPI0018822E8B|nr:Pycsar system effector family protein [Mucilaginibacter sp. JRF]MBE9585210.1 HD domain-containing protein [Mucilaginibacter sp. JRF]
MNYKQLLDEVKEHVIKYFHAHNNPDLVYHNLNHTKNVVAAAMQIANHYQLSDEDYFIVIAGAWFHDMGYMVDASKHEESSAQVAADYLKHKGVDAAVIAKIQGVIMATKMPQNPKNLLEEIMCDADLFHLGTADQRKTSRQLREEMLLFCKKDISKADWRKKTIELMEGHHYFTDYCRLLLDEQKAKNLADLKEKQTKSDTKQQDVVVFDKQTEVAKDDDEPEKKKKDRPERGIETMFRISSTNHQRLSDMADNKAHIMITVNSIILSAIISLVLRKLDQDSTWLIPTVMLISVSLLTITFSILATRPSIPDGRFTRDNLKNKDVNLLFFGNFYRMSLDEYSAGMFQLMEDKEFLYGNLIRDNFSQGVVLGKKYRLLRISYNIFMFGLIVSVFAYIIASVVNGK